MNKRVSQRWCAGIMASIGLWAMTGLVYSEESNPPAAEVKADIAAPAQAAGATAATGVVIKAEVPGTGMATNILVKVDGKAITQSDLDTNIADIEGVMKNRGMTSQQIQTLLPNLKPQCVEELITRALINNECEQRKIAVTDDDVKKAIDKIIATLPKNVTLEGILKQSGITRPMMEADVKQQLKIEKLVNVPEPTDEEVKSFYQDNKGMYETVHARHILFSTKESDDAKTKAAKKEKATGVRKQLTDGADFEKLAKENSDCPSKDKGGDLGTFRRGQMTPAFEQAAFGLKTNEISEVTETEFGYHVIQTLEHTTYAFDEMKPNISARLKDKKVQKDAIALIETLKRKAKIEYVDASLAGNEPDVLNFPAQTPAERKTDEQAPAKR